MKIFFKLTYSQANTSWTEGGSVREELWETSGRRTFSQNSVSNLKTSQLVPVPPVPGLALLSTVLHALTL